jgi:DNA replication protein DnaC
VWSDSVAAARDGYHLIAQGDSGNGKTTLLKRIAHDLIWAGVRVVGGYVPDLLGAIKTDIKDNSEETFGWMSRGEVLLLDDIDKLSGSRFEVERLLTTIDNYSRKKQAILVSTNMTLIRLSEELQTNKWSVPKEHAKALISRLADKADVVTKKAVSFRKVHEHLTDAPVVAKPVDGVSGEELE